MTERKEGPLTPQMTSYFTTTAASPAAILLGRFFLVVLLLSLCSCAMVSGESGSSSLPRFAASHRCLQDEFAAPRLPLRRSTAVRSSLWAQPLAHDNSTSLSVPNLRPLKFHVVSLLHTACEAVGQLVPTHANSAAVTVSCTAADLMTTQKTEVLLSTLNAALEFFSDSLKTTPTSHVEVPAAACIGLDNSAETVEDSDFVLFLSAAPYMTSGSMTLAWGRPCVLDESTDRPIVGLINFIPAALAIASTSLSVKIAMHELTHALGFTNLISTLSSYVDESGQYHAEGGTASVYRVSLQKTVALIKTPRILAAARKHFGCPELDGVEVEDMGDIGTVGSHWKKRLFYDDALAGVITTPQLHFSSMTLAFFEDKGYYKVSYDRIEGTSPWGFQRGCSFLTSSCLWLGKSGEADEFCFTDDSSTTQRCSFNRLSIGRCDVTRYMSGLPSMYQYFSDSSLGGSMAAMDYCPTVVPYDGTDCITSSATTSTSLASSAIANRYGNEYGESSRCFVSNLITAAWPVGKMQARCFPMTCTAAGQVLLRIQGVTVACPADGTEGKADTSQLVGVHGEVECPAASLLCSQQSNDGVASRPPADATPTFNHSSGAIWLDIPSTNEAETNMSCRQRSQGCSAKLWNATYPLCHALVDGATRCFGPTCSLSVKEWMLQQYPDLQTKCTKSPETLASECYDGWEGAQQLCQLLSNYALRRLRGRSRIAAVLLYLALLLL